jgi:hypothetical protein
LPIDFNLLAVPPTQGIYGNINNYINPLPFGVEMDNTRHRKLIKIGLGFRKRGMPCKLSIPNYKN